MVIFFFVLPSVTVIARDSTFFLDEHGSYHMTIMLDPAGDACHPGRIIDDSFERGITLQFAEEFKKIVEERYPGLHVIFTRNAGETVEPLQHANFANRLNVDLYLNINFYNECSSKPTIYIYYFSDGNTLSVRHVDLSFYPCDQAYIFNNERTIRWSNQIKERLSHDTYTPHFKCKGPHGLCFKPLMGIKSPAVAFEFGIKKADDWHMYIEPLVKSLDPIIRLYHHVGDTL